ncbi:MAG TPA: S9 family peptidase [Thermomicrobiaceae bacterium]|nr:S9 family peptidase [Thermomicrobiaceae bacterium]
MRLTPEDEVTLRRISSLEIAPDGSAVVYGVDEADLLRNVRTSRLWLQPTDGGAARPLTVGSGAERAPRFSPDGRVIAFVAGAPGGERLALVGRDGGRPRELLGPGDGFVPQDIYSDPRLGGVPGFAWSPDGTQIACQLRLAPGALGDLSVEGPRDAGDPTVVSEILERRRGGPPVRLCLLDVASRAVVEVGSAPRPLANLCWAPDGRALYAVRRTGGDMGQPRAFQLLCFDIAGGEPRVIAEFVGAAFAPRLSPDGRRFAVAASGGSFHAPAPGLLLLDPADGEQRWSTTDDLTEYRDLVWTGGGALLAVADRGAARGLVRVDPASGTVTPLAAGVPWIEMMRASADGETVALAASALDDPGDVWLVGPADAAPRRLTALNPHLAGFDLGAGRAISWPAPDGTAIEGVLLLPPDADPGRPLPLVVSFHGGPTAHVGLGWNGPHQVWAGAGYAVFAPNFRGSTGYGAAFSEGLRGDIGGKPYTDSIAGIDHLVVQGIADPKRLAIYGHSWGGYMTNWTVTQTDRFRCAVSSGSICDLFSVYGTRYAADVWEWRLLGTPWESFEQYRRWSPLLGVDRVKTPVLILNGAEDRTTPPTQGLEMFTALRKHGVPAEYVVYPREGHAVVEPAHAVDRAGRILEWLRRHLAA